MKLSRTSIIAVLGLSIFSAVAADRNQFTYTGLSYQHHSYDNLNFSPGIDVSELASQYNDSTSESGWRGFIGYQFNRYLAIEAGVTSFGKASFSITEEVTDANGKSTFNTLHSGSFKTIAGDVRAIATYPINDNLFLKAQVGALVWDNEFTSLTGTLDDLSTVKQTDNGVSLLAGAGIGYGFNNVFAVTFDFEQTEIAEITTQNLALSLLVRF